jgi:hypothetical protein
MASKLTSKEQRFQGVFTPRGPNGAWTYMMIPFNVEEAFGSRARVAVEGTVNGFAFRNSLMPNGDGTHHMSVSKEMMAGAGAGQGSKVKVVLRVDDKPREVEVPAELAAEFKKDKAAAKTFETLSPSHKREFTDWISGGKKEETRVTRAGKSVEMIRKKERRP